MASGEAGGNTGDPADNNGDIYDGQVAVAGSQGASPLATARQNFALTRNVCCVVGRIR